MKIVTVTGEALAALRKHKLDATAEDGWTGRNADGSFCIELENDTLARFVELMLTNETISDAIVRIAGGKPS